MDWSHNLRRSSRLRFANSQYDQFYLGYVMSEGESVASATNSQGSGHLSTEDGNRNGALHEMGDVADPQELDFGNATAVMNADTKKKFRQCMEEAETLLYGLKLMKSRSTNTAAHENFQQNTNELEQLSFRIGFIAQKYELDDATREAVVDCINQTNQYTALRDRAVYRSPNAVPAMRNRGFNFKTSLQFDKVSTDPVGYLNWKADYREKIRQEGADLQEEEHRRALSDAVKAASPEAERSNWSQYKTSESLLNAMDEKFGQSHVVERALYDRLNSLPDVRTARWDQVTNFMYQLQTLYNTAVSLNESYQYDGDSSAANDIFGLYSYELVLTKLPEPMLKLVDDQLQGFNPTRHYRSLATRWRTLFEVMDNHRVTLNRQINTQASPKVKSAAKLTARPAAKQSTKIIEHVPAADRKKPAECVVCEEKGHYFFGKDCRSNNGKNKNAMEVLKKKKYCLRCIYPEAECDKRKNACDGKYRAYGGKILGTDCGEGCADGGRPINKKICGHRAKKPEEIDAANAVVVKPAEAHVKVINLARASQSGGPMVDWLEVMRDDGTLVDMEVQYDSGSTCSFIVPDAANEQYRTNVKIESLRVMFADNSEAFLESPALYQIPVCTSAGHREYLECVEYQVFGPDPLQVYEMPRRIEDIRDGKLTLRDSWPRILIGTNHSDCQPKPAKHSGYLPKGFRIWESNLSGRWFLTGCPNYLPTPTANCKKITAKRWGEIERNFERMVEVEADEPQQPRRHKALTADYAQELLQQSLTLMPDKTRWEVTYHYDHNKLAKLQPNREVVHRRMLWQLKKVSKDPEIARHLNAATQKNINNQVWIKVEEAEFEPENQVHYLPIGYQANENSTSTPYRIITDSSCKDHGGLSLNECQLRGQNKIGDLRDIMLRFRLARYAAVGDISSFYYCYELCKPDRSLRRIFVPTDWADPDAALVEMVEAKMPFGDTNAGALAVLGRIKNAELNVDKVAEHLRGRVLNIYRYTTYIDDVVAYGDDPADLDDTIKAVETVAEQASYVFKEWVKSGDVGAKAKVLGYKWNPEADSIAVKSQFNAGKKIRGKKVEANITAETINSIFEGKLTKRQAVALNGQFFDPAQLFGPLSVKMRLATSRINMAVDHKNWDAVVPDELKDELKVALTEAMKVVGFEVPRRLHPVEMSNAEGSVIFFCDGSLSAYGAVAYWRPGPLTEHTSCRIIASAAGTCLRKKFSAPRSELMGAVKAADLYVAYHNTVAEFLQPQRVYFFTDSEVLLKQLQHHSGKFNVFTGTRLQHIKETTPRDAWFHVPTDWNPADLLTRSSATFEDVTGEFWQTGGFINRPVCKWPLRTVVKTSEDLPDIEFRGRVAAVNSQPAAAA